MANLGSLVATVAANTKPFQKGMGQAKGSLGAMQQSTKKFSVGGMIAKLGLAAAAFKLVSSAITNVKAQMTELDALGKTADKLGMGVQQLGQLRFAAEKSGVATGTLDMAMQRMVRRVSEAAMGTGEAVKAIAELGLSAKDLASQSPDEQMRTLADAMKKVKNPADRVRLAMKLFDSEGVALVNMLKNGSGALDEQGEAFDRLHGKLSRADVAKIEEANDAWKDLKVAIKGAWAQFTVAIAPVMKLLAKFITGVVTAGKAVVGAFGRLFGFNKKFVDIAEQKRKEEQKIAQQQKAQAAAAQEKLTKEKLAAEALQKQTAELRKQGESIRQQFMDPQEKLNARIGDLNRLVDAGAISWQTYNRAVAGAVKNMKDANKQTSKLSKRQAVGAVTRGSTAAFSAVQAAKRDAEHQRRVQAEQLAEQRETNRILDSIDVKTEPTTVSAVKI